MLWHCKDSYIQFRVSMLKTLTGYVKSVTVHAVCMGATPNVTGTV